MFFNNLINLFNMFTPQIQQTVNPPCFTTDSIFRVRKTNSWLISVNRDTMKGDTESKLCTGSTTNAHSSKYYLCNCKQLTLLISAHAFPSKSLAGS